MKKDSRKNNRKVKEVEQTPERRLTYAEAILLEDVLATPPRSGRILIAGNRSGVVVGEAMRLWPEASVFAHAFDFHHARAIHDQLVEAGLLAEVSADEKGEVARYMPAVSLEHLSVGMMVDRLETIGRWRLSLPLDQLHSESWRAILRMRTGYLGSLRQVLLKDV